MSDEEILDLVDEKDNIIGTIFRSESHKMLYIFIE